MSSRRQLRLLQGEKTNILDVDPGSLVSSRSRAKTPAEVFFPTLSSRSSVSASSSESRINVENLRSLKTGGSNENSSRSKSRTPVLSNEVGRNQQLINHNAVEKLRKEFIERNTLHFTKLREAFRTIDKDHNGCRASAF
jgi:hypothetical protein